MTIDQRLAALTPAVKLTASMQRDAETRAEKNRVEDLERMRKLELYATRMMQSITRLSNIATVHDI